MPQHQKLLSTPSPQVDVHEFLQKILFSNDVTDTEHFTQKRSLVFESPDHRMRFRILEEAFDDYTKNIAQEKNAQKRLFAEVFDWFFNEHNSSWPCSFVTICQLFDLDPGYIRKGIILWTKNYFAKPPPPPPEVTVPIQTTKTYPNKYVDIMDII